MRLIGMLGGMGWRSTLVPYRLLNEEIERRLGPGRSARIALYSVDYGPFRSGYAEDWSALPALLEAEVRTLLAFAPDCWMIANNTLHTVYDRIAPALPAAPPLFHAVRLVRDHLLARGVRRVLLLGTRFTMEDGYYADPLRAAGIDVVIPAEADRARIAEIQIALDHGAGDAAFADYFAGLIARHAAEGCEAVIAGCTELPLAIDPARAPIEVVDPLRLQCIACADFALA